MRRAAGRRREEEAADGRCWAGEATGVVAEEIGGWNRRRPVVRARRLVVLVAVGHLGRTLTEVAAVVGVSVQGASNLLHGGRGDRAALVQEAQVIGDGCWVGVGTDSSFQVSPMGYPRERAITVTT